MKETSYNKKRIHLIVVIRCFPIFDDKHPSSTKVEIRCYFYNKIINITKNKSNITTNAWFFVIDITTLLFNLNFIEGKATDISNVSELIVTDI